MFGRALGILMDLVDDNIAAWTIARADLARSLRRFRDAGLLYDDALDLRPGRADIALQSAHMFKEAGDLENARTRYEAAAAAMIDDPDVHLQIGHFHKVAGEVDRARAAYERAAALKPDWPEPRRELAALPPPPR